MVYLILLIITSVVVYSAPIDKNNVCDDLKAYANLIQDRKHCYYNPDLDSTPHEIAERYGYKVEDHLVENEDGYILTIFRISKMGDQVKNKQPALLQHGILVDGVSWMISGNGSLAFTLVTNGYDLWVPNGRGTLFSSKHTNSSISDKDYWNFSFHEMGVKDLPAIIEYVSEATKRRDLIYIGHSMGSTTALVYSSLLKDHAKKYLRGVICLAPVAHFRTPRGLLRLAASFYQLLQGFFEFLGLYAVGQFTALQKFILSISCSRYPLILPCQVIYALSTGLALDQVRPDMLPIIMSFFPAGTSTKTLFHFLQILLSEGRFQRYDYGYSVNEKMYDSPKPPKYPVEGILVPVHIFSGTKDFIATDEDAKYLYQKLKSPKRFHKYDLAHNDYAYGKKVNKLYGDILNVMKNNFITGTDIEYKYA